METTEIALRETAVPLEVQALDETAQFMSWFVDAEPTKIDAMTLWAAHTHALTAFPATPRLLLTSDKPGCGKSQALGILRLLTRNGWALSPRTTSFGVRAKLACPPEDRPTVIFDEANIVFGKSGLNGGSHAFMPFLLQGYTPGAVETFAVNHAPVDYDLYTVVALGGRGNAVPDDVRDRSVVVRMRAGTPRRQYTTREHAPDAARLQRALSERFRARLADLEAFRCKGLHPRLTGRRMEIWEPLIAIAYTAGGSWPRRAMAAFLDLAMDQGGSAPVLTPRQVTLRDMLAAAEEMAAIRLREMRRGEDRKGDIRLGATAMAVRMMESDDRAYEGATLRSVTMRMADAMAPEAPVQWRIDGKPVRGYALATVRRMAMMYLPPAEEDEETAPLPADDDDVSIFDVADDDDTVTTSGEVVTDAAA